MSLFFAELRKVWGGRVFPALLAILAAANLLLLWMGTRPTAKQPPASAYRAVGAELSDKTMEEKGTYLHDKYTEIESLVKIGQYYREQAYGGYGLTQYRQDNAAMFDAYEQEYTDKTYTLFTDNLNTEYRLFSQLQSEYDTVAAYSDFLDSVQTKASQLSGISIFQNDRTGYDLKNIELTAQVYAGLTETPIDYYPQKGLYTAISYAFTDLILLASMLLLALILVRQERDSGLLSLIRSLPGGRLKTAIAKLAAFAASLLVVLMVLYGVNLAYCSASFSLGPMNRTIQSVPALMRCTMQITVGQYLLRFLLAKWAGAWLVYETGYKKLFGFTGTSDVQDTLLAGLLCALCFSGLFAMERKGGMDEILASTPLGRKYTVKAKLRQSTAVASVIAFGTVLPHLWQVLRDYGLPSLLGPAMSISDLQAVPKFITLSDLLLFWLICRFAACLCMSRITLWLGQKLGNLLPALFISAVSYCLPALLSLSGMRNGIEWLGFYPLFHAVALWQNQGYTADGESYNAMWIPIFLVCAAFFLAWAIGQALIDDYDMIGVPDEVL